jgi:hypothetical protein
LRVAIGLTVAMFQQSSAIFDFHLHLGQCAWVAEV